MPARTEPGSPVTQVVLAKSNTLTLSEELEMTLRAPYRNSAINQRLALLFYSSDRYEEALAALFAIPESDQNLNTQMLTGRCHLANKTAEDNAAAAASFEKAVGLAGTLIERAMALSDLGEARKRLGHKAEARELFKAALDLNPRDINGWKRLAAQDLAAGRAQELLERTDAMIAAGIHHACILSARTLALVALGLVSDAADNQGMARFHHEEICAPPNPWTSIEDFNRDLAVEILANPGIRPGHDGKASTATWRVEDLQLRRAKIVPVLLDMLTASVRNYVSRLSPGDHPFYRARPESCTVRSWALIARAAGYEQWHVHDAGWISGVYYVEVPDAVQQSNHSGGCIRFGIPPEYSKDPVAEEICNVTIRPKPGLLILSPSHANHRTFPHGDDASRICVAFDIVPVGDETHS